MADSRARNDHTSDSRATSAIVCVCTTRLPLKMQARPATSGLKDAPSRELYGVQAAEACGCGSHLSDEPSVRKAARLSVTKGRCGARSQRKPATFPQVLLYSCPAGEGEPGRKTSHL